MIFKNIPTTKQVHIPWPRIQFTDAHTNRNQTTTFMKNSMY